MATFLEFFAGIGLMRLGLERAGWRIAYANDIEADKRDMYDTHFGDADRHFHLGDVHEIDAATLPNATLATASFPCNDLSLAGARAGLQGINSSAYWGFTRAIENMGARRPPIIMLENVAGFHSSRGGTDFAAALRELNRLGYVVDAFLINAEHFVPQSRLRLFVVAHRTDASEHALEEPQPVGFYASEIRPTALASFIFDHPEINWSIRSLPPLPSRTLQLEDVIDQLPSDHLLWWNDQRTAYLLNQMSPRHLAIAEGMRAGSTISFGTVFRRVRQGRSMAELRNDGVAGCLRTPRGGSGRQILLQAGLGEIRVRLLTGEECARLMGADGFRLNVPLNQALFGFGDAVCVDVVAWIAQHYLNPLCEELQCVAHAALPLSQTA
jgi:DNA (cytosine-5)-methyltransferase 1